MFDFIIPAILVILVLILLTSNIRVVQQIGRASCRERVLFLV